MSMETTGWWQGLIISGIALVIYRRRRRLKEKQDTVPLENPLISAAPRKQN
jgi:hypothetical protein